MINTLTTSPLHQKRISSNRLAPMNWREKGIGISRIIFCLAWAVAAVLKWHPQFQQTFVDQVSGASAGQPAPIMGWISFWTDLVSVNLLLFARIEATPARLLAASQTTPTNTPLVA